jgi:lipopolysaccharide export system protein LptA
LIGGVTVTQGQNVIRGDRIVVDLTTGVTRVESGGNGEVSGLFLPNAPKTDPNKKTDTKTDTKAAPKAAPKQGLNQPLKLN